MGPGDYAPENLSKTQRWNRVFSAFSQAEMVSSAVSARLKNFDQGRSQKFIFFGGGGIKILGEVWNFNSHCGISSITVLTSLLLHKSLLSLILGGYIQGGPKKVSLRSLHITSSNTGRFSKFFHYHVLQEICNKEIIKYSTSPQTCRYTTLWNIYVRKLVNQWNLSHYFVSQNWNITNICNIPDQCCW